MFRKKNVISDQEKLLIYLEDFYSHCQYRITAGDLDIDDWIYRGRDAAQTLIDILSEEEDDAN